MSRSPWADQSRRSDIRHLRDGSSHRSLTRRLTQARTQTQSEHIVGHVAGVRTITENQHKHALNRGGGQGREIVRRQTCWAESFPSQILCLSPISAILLSACQLDEMTPTLIRLSVQRNCCTCHMLTDWKLRTLLKVTDSGFPPGGGRGSQTCNSLCSHVYAFARFLIASVRGCGLWGESGTDNNNHFVFAYISHSKNNQRW